MTSFAAHCEKLHQPTRRLIALTAIPLIAGLAWAVIVIPGQAIYRSQADWRADAIATLSRVRQAKSVGDELSERLKSLPAAAIWNKFYTVNKAGSAGSMLQADVGGVLNSIHAGVQSLTPLRTTDVNGLNTVGLRVVASMTIDQLKNFLAGIANHVHYLRVERLRINAPPTQTPEQNAMLTVTIEIYGVERVRNETSAANGTKGTQGGGA